jgi:hypothetical protein
MKIKINNELTIGFSKFIKDKYQDDIIWDGGNPTHPFYLDLWCAWQASTQRQGYKLVPVELSDEQLNKIDDSFVDDGDYKLLYKLMIDVD